MAWSTEISQLVTETQQFIDAVELNKPTLDTAANTAVLNAASASVSAANTVVTATASTTSVDVSKGHAVATEAIANLTKMQQDAVSDSERQASLAAGYALSAGTIVQQDLTEVTAAALHRSPGAVTSMFIYDTSKDSDGGAWTEKCQNTSWYNEDITGKWLGQQPTELYARYEGATLGTELVINGSFSSSLDNWAPGAGWTWDNGTAKATTTASTISQTVGSAGTSKTFRVSFNQTIISGARLRVRVRNFASNADLNFEYRTGSQSVVIYVTSPDSGITIVFNAEAAETLTVDNVSIREVGALTAQSGDYFQSIVDGKFYRLWKNLVQNSGDLTQSSWGRTALTPSIVSVTPPTGVVSSVTNLLPDATNVVHKISATVTQIGLNGSISFYVRDNGARYFGVRTLGSSNASYAFFDLQNPGTVTVGNNSASNFTTSTLTDVGGGWYRAVVSPALPGGASTNTISIYVLGSQPASAGGFNEATLAFLGSGAGIYIAGVQAEFSLVPTVYEAKAAVGHTSEVFRGNKRDFPRLAAIVAESNNLTIYDLTEPGRPMWMRFLGNPGFLAWLSSAINISGISAVNGYIVPVSSSNMGGLVLNFAKDDAILIWNGSYVLRKRQLVDRNVLNSFSAEPGGFIVAGTLIRGIAMTVLPDAPADPVTGLKVPTIAIGTNSGVSIIQNTGVVNTIGTADNQRGVAFIGKMLVVEGVRGVVYSQWTADDVTKGTAAIITARNPGRFENESSVPAWLAPSTQGTLASVMNRSGSYKLALSKINRENATRSLYNHTTEKYNTGWLPGDMRRVYLSDTGVGTVAGTELVVNGGFTTDLTGWSDNISATWDAGSVLLNATSASAQLAQSFTTVVGRTYLLGYQFVSGNTGNSVLRIGTAANSASILNLAMTAGVGSFSRTFIATSTTTWVTLFVAYPAVSINGKWDNISVREAVEDRSYKAQATPVTGTITRSQLASGTSLVGYSGWSTANYLQEPYSADLDFGTGEFSTSAWFNTSISRRNLLTYSEDFSNVTWSKTNVTASPHNVADPDGGFTASTITATTASGYFFYNSASNPTSGSTTVSLWIRRRTGTGDIRLRTAAVGVDTIIDVTSSWQRISVVCVAIAATSNCWVLNIVTSGDAVDIWHPQLELGSVATSYQKVITASDVISPIFDRAHSFGPRVRLAMNGLGNLAAEASDGTTTRTATTTATYNIAQWVKAETTYTTDGSLGIRVNGREVAVTRGNPLLTLNSRRNLLTWTEQFDNALWLRPAGTTTISPNTATAPDGTMTADLVTATAGNNCHYVYQANLGTASVTFSVYAKAGTASWIGIGSGYTNGGETAWFNLATGTPGTVSSGGTSTMVDALNGWWRCSITRPTWVAGGALVFITNADAAPTFNAVGTETVLLWGAQGEIGTAPTTYQRITATPETNVAPLTIGNSFAFDAPFPGSIALLKLGATVPTTEQSTFMYEQEKQLFRANAVSVLPDATSVLDMSYDDATDRWSAISATNESYWTGLIRNSVTPVPAGSYSKITTTSGIELSSRITTSPGVDVSIPTYLLREDLNKRAEAASKVFKEIVNFDYVGGFTASTTIGSTAITSVANLTYPVSLVGARISGAGIPTNATIVAVSGTTIYISAAATATATGVSISFLDFNLSTGFEAETVTSAGAIRREGATADFTRLFDGFIETIRFAVAPGATTWVQIQASRIIP